MMNTSDFDPDIRRVAHLMADAARQVILPYFRRLICRPTTSSARVSIR